MTLLNCLIRTIDKDKLLTRKNYKYMAMLKILKNPEEVQAEANAKRKQKEEEEMDIINRQTSLADARKKFRSYVDSGLLKPSYAANQVDPYR